MCFLQYVCVNSQKKFIRVFVYFLAVIVISEKGCGKLIVHFDFSFNFNSKEWKKFESFEFLEFEISKFLSKNSKVLNFYFQKFFAPFLMLNKITFFLCERPNFESWWQKKIQTCIKIICNISNFNVESFDFFPLGVMVIFLLLFIFVQCYKN